MGVRKMGVEEELLLVDPETGRLTAVAQSAVQADGEVEAELFLQQIETATEPCTGLDELDGQLRARRATLREAAAAAGAAAVAVALPVLPYDGTDITPKPRYRRIHDEYGELARTSLACATHVHIDIDSREEGVRVVDGIAPWLPVLLAISANSPFHHGTDTGHASWRPQVWGRWPSHGAHTAFGSVAAYDEVVDTLQSWGAALDEGMVYLDARLSQSYPTVEVRVADVCTDVEDAVLVAALSRALVATAATETAGAGGEPWRGDLLRAATWRASRDGTTGQLVHPLRRELATAREVLEATQEHVRDALDEAGDTAQVADLVERLLARGNGAVRQRRTFEATGDLAAVVRDLVDRT